VLVLIWYRLHLPKTDPLKRDLLDIKAAQGPEYCDLSDGEDGSYRVDNALLL
jgi:hypothetical protein